MGLARYLLWLGVIALAVLGCAKPDFSARERSAGVLRWALRNDFAYLDPAQINEDTTRDVLRQVFETLVALDAQGRVIPSLATPRQISASRYEFRLKPGVKFASGAPLTAESVVRSLRRSAQPNLGGGLGAAWLKNVRTVEATGPTVQIELREAEPLFLARLAYPGLAIVGPGAPFGQTIGAISEMDGTGPFVPVSYTPGHLELRAKPNYHGGVPGIRGIRFDVMKDVETRRLKFLAGEIDLATVSSDVARQFQGSPRRAELHLTPKPVLIYVQLNGETYPALRDRRFRRALWQALDPDVLAQMTHGLYPLAKGFVPPGLPGAGPSKLPAFDPKAAKWLVSSFGKLPRLTLTYSDANRDNPVVESIITQWHKRLGLEVVGETFDRMALKDRNLAGNLAVFFTGYSADVPSPADILGGLFRSNSQENHSGYRNAEFDRALDAGDFELAQRLLAQDLPVLPLYFQVEPELVSARIKNLTFSPWGHLSLARVQLRP